MRPDACLCGRGADRCGDLHGLGERGAGGQSVCAEGAGVAAAPVVDDVPFARAPQHAHHGLLKSLRRARSSGGVRQNSHTTLNTSLVITNTNCEFENVAPKSRERSNMFKASEAPTTLESEGQINESKIEADAAIH